MYKIYCVDKFPQLKKIHYQVIAHIYWLLQLDDMDHVLLFQHYFK